MNNYKPHLTDECLLEKLNQIINEGCGDLGDLLILRLYHKVMALEAALEDEITCNETCNTTICNRLQKLEDKSKSTSNLKKVKGSSHPPIPNGFLVESVAAAISDVGEGAYPFVVNAWKPEARAAIRVVAAALMEWYDSDQLILTALDAAKWLEQEAER